MRHQDAPAVTGASALGIDSPEFLERLQALETDAVEVVYALHAPKLLAYAYRHTGDWNLAQDMVADAFVRLLESVHRFQPRGSSLLAWLYRVTRNLIIDQRRKASRRPAVALDLAESRADPKQEFSAEVHDLVRELASLAPDQQEVLLLRFQQGLSAEEAGVVLGRSSSAARSLQHRALEALRQRLDTGDA